MVILGHLPVLATRCYCGGFGCWVVVTPAGKSSREVSRRSHSDFSMPRICEQSGLLLVVPTPRDAGGTASGRVATLERLLPGGKGAAFGVFGDVVCCGIELDDAVGGGAAGGDEVCADGGGAAGGCEVAG